ncbi:hypothetical protein HDV00_006660 [Rhizophlyctis rosea]|nr:hypothetical protein HDV00_006660 [Rhizophlyctis rosea]
MGEQTYVKQNPNQFQQQYPQAPPPQYPPATPDAAHAQYPAYAASPVTPHGAPYVGHPQAGQPQHTVVYMQAPPGVGACPQGGPHQPQKEFTVCGWIMAIIFFPIGVLCCFAMQEKRCMKCNALC